MDFSGFMLPPDAFYPPPASHAAPTWAGSFQRPARIPKTSNRNISPHNTAQRRFKSLTHAPSRARSVVDRRPTYPHSQSVYDQLRARPISWHTSDHPVSTAISNPDDFSVDSFNSPSAHTTTREVNGLFTPLLAAHVDEPHIMGMSTPLEDMSAFELNSYNTVSVPANFHGHDYLSFEPYHKQPTNQYLMQGGYEPSYYDMYNQFQNTKIQTAPPSPTFLPIQSNVATSKPYLLFDSNENAQGEELVGMGLYDPPADAQTMAWNSSPISGHRGSIGKGLKLEDSFEPPDDESDDEEEDIATDLYDRGTTHSSRFIGSQQIDALANGDLQEQSFYFGDNDNDVHHRSDINSQPYSLSGWAPAHAEGGYGWI